MHWGNLNFATIVMNLFCIPFGAYGLVVGTYSYFWQPQIGEITSAEAVIISSGNGWDKRAKIEFSYTVNNQVYNSNMVHIRPRLSTKNRRVNISYLKQYRLGNKVTVFYSERWPHLSTLNKGISINTVLVVLFSFLLAWIGRVAKKRDTQKMIV
jgi:hypothetical protein